MRLPVLVASALALAACDAGDPAAPTSADDLVGTWGSVAVEETVEVTSPTEQTAIDFDAIVPAELSVSGLPGLRPTASAQSDEQTFGLRFWVGTPGSPEVGLWVFESEGGRFASMSTLVGGIYATYDATPVAPLFRREGATVVVPDLTLPPADVDGNGATGPVTVRGRATFPSARLRAGEPASVQRSRTELPGTRGTRPLLYQFAADGTFRRQDAGADGRGPVRTDTGTWELDGDQLRVTFDETADSHASYSVTYRVRVGGGRLALGESRTVCRDDRCLAFVAPRLGLETSPTAYALWQTQEFVHDGD